MTVAQGWGSKSPSHQTGLGEMNELRYLDDESNKKSQHQHGGKPSPPTHAFTAAESKKLRRYRTNWTTEPSAVFFDSRGSGGGPKAQPVESADTYKTGEP